MAALEVATERQEASARLAEAKAGSDSKTRGQLSAEKSGTAAAPPPKRRSKKRRGANAADETTPVFRFFLAKNGSNGTPERDHEVEDENTAMVEALKMGATFIMLSEWQPTVDNSTKGRPVITKEAVSRSK